MLFLADVSGQRNCLIFKGHGAQDDVLTLDEVTDTLSRNVHKNQNTFRNDTEERRALCLIL